MFRPHRSTTHVDAAHCYRRSSVVYRVGLSVTIVSPAKTAEHTEMPLANGPPKHALDSGTHWRHLANMTEPSMCVGDAAFCRITLTTCCYRYLGGDHFPCTVKLSAISPSFRGTPTHVCCGYLTLVLYQKAYTTKCFFILQNVHVDLISSKTLKHMTQDLQLSTKNRRSPKPAVSNTRTVSPTRFSPETFPTFPQLLVNSPMFSREVVALYLIGSPKRSR